MISRILPYSLSHNPQPVTTFHWPYSSHIIRRDHISPNTTKRTQPNTILSLTILSLTILSLTILSLTILSLTILSLTILSLTILSLTILSLTILRHTTPSLTTQFYPTQEYELLLEGKNEEVAFAEASLVEIQTLFEEARKGLPNTEFRPPSRYVLFRFLLHFLIFFFLSNFSSFVLFFYLLFSGIVDTHIHVI